MKMSDHRLKRLLQENPVPVKPEKKKEMLEFARSCDEKTEETEDGSTMKFIKMKKVRTLIAAAAILSLTAVAVTAGIVHYYYRTPGGNIFDESGTMVSEPENIALKMTDTEIRGIGYTIAEVNWVRTGGSTTLTVWTTADSVELKGLRAKIGETEYPLNKSFVTKDKDGNPLYIGYTAANVPEPESDTVQNDGLALWIDEPEKWHGIFFVPEDAVVVEDTSENITVTGCYYDGLLYLGASLDLEGTHLQDYVTNVSIGPAYHSLTDISGNEISERPRQYYGIGDGASFDRYTELPEDFLPGTFRSENVYANYTIRPVENVTYCDIPIPEKGETLTGEWVFCDFGGIKRTITEITRDKYYITLYSPDSDKVILRSDNLPAHDYIPEGLVAENATQIQIGYISGGEGLAHPSVTQPKDGYLFRFVSKTLDEYCETHDTVRVGLGSLFVTYSGDWTLTFPEN